MKTGVTNGARGLRTVGTALPARLRAFFADLGPGLTCVDLVDVRGAVKLGSEPHIMQKMEADSVAELVRMAGQFRLAPEE